MLPPWNRVGSLNVHNVVKKLIERGNTAQVTTRIYSLCKVTGTVVYKLSLCLYYKSLRYEL